MRPENVNCDIAVNFRVIDGGSAGQITGQDSFLEVIYYSHMRGEGGGGAIVDTSFSVPTHLGWFNRNEKKIILRHILANAVRSALKPEGFAPCDKAEGWLPLCRGKKIRELKANILRQKLAAMK